MPSLLLQLDGAARGTGIKFTRITTGERTPVAAAPAATAGSTPPAGTEGSGTTPAANAGGQPASTAPGQAAEGANNAAAQGNDAAAQSGVDPTTSTTASNGALPVGGGSTAPAGAEAAAPAALETIPLELEFTGDFFRLADFFHDIKRFVHVVNDDVVVNGRLVTVDSVNYTSDPLLFPRLRAQIKATVYLVAEDRGRHGGRDPAGSRGHGPRDHPGGRTRAVVHAFASPDRHGDSLGLCDEDLPARPLA